jgi:exonuclease III
LRIVTVNVTTLTKDRLDTVCEYAVGIAAQVVLLQETRHYGDTAWIKWRATQWGYRAHLSPPVDLDLRGVRNYGGTAILWLHELGKTSASPSDSHRLCGRKWDDMEILSVYGPVQKPDAQFCARILRKSDETPGLLVAAGDWNWKPSYTRALTSRRALGPHGPSCENSAH